VPLVGGGQADVAAFELGGLLERERERPLGP